MRPHCAAASTYRSRQPEHTALYRTVAAHLEAVLARAAGNAERSGLPVFAKREFEGYLRGSILQHPADLGLLAPVAPRPCVS